MMGPMRGRAIALATSLTLVLVPGVAHAADTGTNASASDARITTKLAKRLHNVRLGKDVSVVVMNRDSGQLVFSTQPDARQLPASNMKVVTATTALTSLAPDTRFTTRVLSTGAPNDIVLQGGGDPLLNRTQLRDLAAASAAGLDPAQPVTVHADVSRFGTPIRPQGWPSTYVPSVVAPVTSLAMYGDYSTDPTGHAVDAFITKLRTLGFTVARGADVTSPADAAEVAVAPGHSVTDAIAVMLRDSENNIAEVLFRQVAIAAGQPGTWAGARTAATAILGNLGVDTTGLQLRDGSGLSRLDRLTAASLASVLRLTRTDARYAPMYTENAMPIAGVSGTLAAKYGRFTTAHAKCAARTTRAKTGSLRDTIALSGITTGADGQEKVFSILVNHQPKRFSQLATRQAVDGLVATIAGCW